MKKSMPILPEQLPVLPTELSPSAVERLINAFLSGRNANTLSAYRMDLVDFQDFLGLRDVASTILKLLQSGPGNANLLVLEYRNDLKERGLQSATINRRLSSLRAAVKMARMLGMVSWSLEVPNEKAQSYRDTRGVGIGGVEAILTELRNRNHPKATRDIAIIRLFYDIGLRVSELVGLDLSDLDLERGEIKILGKGRTQKEALTIPEPTVQALKNWLTIRKSESDALFINFDRAKKGNGRITRFGVYKVIRWLGKRVNLKTRPHGFRHDAVTSAVRLAQENDIGLEQVLKFSRHKNLATLQVYVDAIENKQGEIATLVARSVKNGKR